MFSSNSPLVKAVLKFVDLLMLNALWILSSVPLFTIGIATTAALDVVRRDILGNEGMVVTDYLRALKANCKQGLLAGTAFVVVSLVCAVDIVMLRTMLSSGAGVGILWIIPLLLIVLAVSLFFWSCAHIAYFNQEIRVIFRNCFILSVVHFPVSLVVIISWLACGLAIWVYPGTLFLVPALCLLMNGLLLRKALLQHVQEDKDEGKGE